MSKEVTTAESVDRWDGLWARVLHWFVLDGNRFTVSAILVAAIGVFFFLTTRAGVLAIGPNSIAGTAFASGIIAGTFTVTTIALSINQLILSRVFGSPNELFDQLNGTWDLRTRVGVHADESAVPNDPAKFLDLVAGTLTERAIRFGSACERAGVDLPREVEDYATGIADYGESMAAEIADETDIVNVLDVILGTEYAQNLTATRYIQNEYGDRLPDAAAAELDVIGDLLEAVAVTRQFFKTLSLQQDFARLSRFVAYSGLVALVASVSMALIYRGDAVTVPAKFLPIVFGVAMAVILTPLVVFIAYLIRAATIARHSVSVGPFMPAQERDDDG